LADNRQHRSYRSIGDVVATLQDRYPDVTPSSLRFLEREGLLSPQRTAGGHRYYSDRDIERVARIKEWQKQRLSLNEVRDRLAESDQLAEPAALSTRFLEQVLERDYTGAFRSIVAADDLGVPLVTQFGEVLAPALHEVGDRWQHGDLLVSQEKEVSELSRDVIAELSWRHAHVRPGGPSIVAGCVQGERHELGLRMTTGLLRAEGWMVHYLGADVAPQFLLESTRLHRAAAVLLSITMEDHFEALTTAIATLRQTYLSGATLPVIVGGDAVRSRLDALQGLDVVAIEETHPGRMLERLQAVLPARSERPAGLDKG
jgi:methanogenic corrinoid protein MtbC1